MTTTFNNPLRPDMCSVVAMTRAMIAHGGDTKAFARHLVQLAAAPGYRGHLGSAALSYDVVREPLADRAFRLVLRDALDALDDAETDAEDAANAAAVAALDAAP